MKLRLPRARWVDTEDLVDHCILVVVSVRVCTVSMVVLLFFAVECHIAAKAFFAIVLHHAAKAVVAPSFTMQPRPSAL